MSKKKETIEQIVEHMLDTRLKSLLEDVRYRISILEETQRGIESRVHAHDLNLATHILEGYIFTNNSPAAGSVAWSDVNIVYKGTTYAITNGNTANKYIWWDFDASPNTVLQSSNTKPNLTIDDVLVGINDGGIFRLMMAPGKMVPGSAILDGSVGANELNSGAVTSDKLAALTVIEGKIADGAISAGKLASGAVTGPKLASGAVGATALADGAVIAAKIGSSAVDSTKLADNAVITAKIAAGAVDGTKIGSKAVGTTNLADGAVGATQLASNAVTSAKIADGAVIGIKIGAGAVAEDKLNLATHFLF